jgi:GNAT superfamily N-acetyltransferase
VAPPITTRPACGGDLDTMLCHVQAGFDSYVEFAPPGWRPPRARDGRERMLLLLGEPSTFALLALLDDSPAGHVSFRAAREHAPTRVSPDPLADPVIPGLAHFWQLFVLPRYWGQGVAAQLHDAAVAEMRARGYAAARLFTPSLHARARRFYERHGWLAGGEHWNEHFQLSMVEYRLALDWARPPG